MYNFTKEVIGFVGFDACRDPNKWSSDDLTLLRDFAKVVSALQYLTEAIVERKMQVEDSAVEDSASAEQLQATCQEFVDMAEKYTWALTVTGVHQYHAIAKMFIEKKMLTRAAAVKCNAHRFVILPSQLEYNFFIHFQHSSKHPNIPLSTPI